VSYIHSMSVVKCIPVTAVQHGMTISAADMTFFRRSHSDNYSLTVARQIILLDGSIVIVKGISLGTSSRLTASDKL
jgi:hypothetical protein